MRERQSEGKREGASKLEKMNAREKNEKKKQKQNKNY